MKTGSGEGPGIWGSIGWLILFFFLQGLTSVLAGMWRAYEVGPGQEVVLDARFGTLLSIALLTSAAAIIVLLRKRLLIDTAKRIHQYWWKVGGLLLLAVIVFNMAYGSIFLGDRLAQPEMVILVEAARTGILSGIVVFATVVFVAPIAEELLFRGQLQPAIERRFGPWPSIIVPAIFFGAIHLQPLAAPPLILVGAILGWLRWKTGSLTVPIAFHIFMNAAAFVAMFFGLMPQ